MGNELKLNSAEEAEVVLIRLTPEEYPIAYANKVKCLMLSGLSKKEAERMAIDGITTVALRMNHWTRICS